MDIGLRLLVENGLFFAIATGFLVLSGWAWRNVTPFQLPKPLPGWFKLWFGSVIVLGSIPPLAVLIWSVWHGYRTVWMVLTAYFVMLILQVVSESLTLRRFQSVVWVMVPYLYVPYRLWQLYEGFLLVRSPASPTLHWIQIILIGEIVVWAINYLLDLAQLPRLFQWTGTQATERSHSG
ncbi:MAG: hypothetical protein VKL39_09500 [Leptolyngbyaceae bacterium]|nr:hypothetical protein [Leptolyngbyaceae bacterium]